MTDESLNTIKKIARFRANAGQIAGPDGFPSPENIKDKLNAEANAHVRDGVVHGHTDKQGNFIPENVPLKDIEDVNIDCKGPAQEQAKQMLGTLALSIVASGHGGDLALGPVLSPTDNADMTVQNFLKEQQRNMGLPTSGKYDDLTQNVLRQTVSYMDEGKEKTDMTKILDKLDQLKELTQSDTFLQSPCDVEILYNETKQPDAPPPPKDSGGTPMSGMF